MAFQRPSLFCCFAFLTQICCDSFLLLFLVADNERQQQLLQRIISSSSCSIWLWICLYLMTVTIHTGNNNNDNNNTNSNNNSFTCRRWWQQTTAEVTATLTVPLLEFVSSVCVLFSFAAPEIQLNFQANNLADNRYYQNDTIVVY